MAAGARPRSSQPGGQHGQRDQQDGLLAEAAADPGGEGRAPRRSRAPAWRRAATARPTTGAGGTPGRGTAAGRWRSRSAVQPGRGDGDDEQRGRPGPARGLARDEQQLSGGAAAGQVLLGAGRVGQRVAAADAHVELAAGHPVQDLTGPPLQFGHVGGVMRQGGPGHEQRPAAVEPLEVEGRHLATGRAVDHEHAAGQQQADPAGRGMHHGDIAFAHRIGADGQVVRGHPLQERRGGDLRAHPGRPGTARSAGSATCSA